MARCKKKVRKTRENSGIGRYNYHTHKACILHAGVFEKAV